METELKEKFSLIKKKLFLKYKLKELKIPYTYLKVYGTAKINILIGCAGELAAIRWQKALSLSCEDVSAMECEDKKSNDISAQKSASDSNTEYLLFENNSKKYLIGAVYEK